MAGLIVIPMQVAVLIRSICGCFEDSVFVFDVCGSTTEDVGAGFLLLILFWVNYASHICGFISLSVLENSVFASSNIASSLFFLHFYQGFKLESMLECLALRFVSLTSHFLPAVVSPPLCWFLSSVGSLF